jgi:cell division protease FtsH
MSVNSGWFKNSFVWLIIMVAVVALILNAFPQAAPGAKNQQPEEITISRLAELITSKQVTKMTLHQDTVDIDLVGGSKAILRKDSTTTQKDLEDLLATRGVASSSLPPIEISKPSEWGTWLAFGSTIIPILLIGAFLFIILRQAQGANNQAMSFGKSRARMFSSNRPPVTFADVAGVDEAKQELQEVVEFLKYPEKFTALGARIPKGVLLVGPPGVGKTLLARAVAGEAGVPFFSISGSEFVEMFVGVGASRVRDLFDQAKKNSPCIVFVDELDAVGRHRGAGLGGSHDEREQTLNQILVEMDGFDSNVNIIVLAATNRPDILDPALLRPGRFDRQVVLDKPDINGRKQILELYVKNKPMEPDISLDDIARSTPGFSGADLSNLMNEAAILTARRNKKQIGESEIEEAVERLMAGPEKKSRVISNREKAIIAYHEAGHAVVMRMLPNCDPVHKMSVISRGMALGYTMPLPAEDRHLMSRAKFHDDLAGLMGGHMAEKLVFGDLTTGSGNDLDRATTIARRMVTEWGMSDKLGPRTFGKREELVFLGREITEQRNYSEQIAVAIDEEVKNIIEQATNSAQDILKKYRHILDAVAERLMKEETIDSTAFDAMFGDIKRPEPVMVGPVAPKVARVAVPTPVPVPVPVPTAA